MFYVWLIYRIQDSWLNSLNGYDIYFWLRDTANQPLVRVRRYISLTTLKTIYNALIYPHMTYCNILWASTYETKINGIYKIQKKIIRIMTFSKYRQESIFPLFKTTISISGISEHIRVKFLPHSDICAFLFARKFTLSLQRLFFNKWYNSQV